MVVWLVVTLPLLWIVVVLTAAFVTVSRAMAGEATMANDPTSAPKITKDFI